MLEFKIDDGNLSERLINETYNNIIKLKTTELRDSVLSWQENNFQRKRPNVEQDVIGMDTVSVSTSFWERQATVVQKSKTRKFYSLGRAIKRSLGARRRSDILRPQKIVSLYVGVIKLVMDMCKWPR
jgi:hypothetical protein